MKQLDDIKKFYQMNYKAYLKADAGLHMYDREEEIIRLVAIRETLLELFPEFVNVQFSWEAEAEAEFEAWFKWQYR